MELIIHIKMDSALNKLQRLIYHKNPPTNQPTLLKNIIQIGEFIMM